MIHYSPMSRYTAQRIADKVGNGAYFYSHFSVEAESHDFYASIRKLIQKLTQRYHLDLSTRQRTYRLNKRKEPIADLVVQKRVGLDIFDFWLLITTPNSNAYNLAKVAAPLKNSKLHQKVVEVEAEPLIWNKTTEQQEVQLIQAYFKDEEAFKLALYQPIKLNFGDKKEVELVRLSHSSKPSKLYAAVKKSAKNYTWTWRYTKASEELLKQSYRSIINDLISNANKDVGISKLTAFYKDLKDYTVFKGNRHQVGKIFVEMSKYHWKKAGSDFRKAAYYVPLELKYLERQKIYAEDAYQFMVLRRLYEATGKEFTNEILVGEDYTPFITQYLI